MNKRGGFVTGMAFSVVAFILIITLFAIISPFNENLDNSRGADSTLNCPGTPDFNQTNYDDDSTSEKLIRRPTCFVTGLSMVWFVGAYLISVIVWLYSKWLGR